MKKQVLKICVLGLMLTLYPFVVYADEYQDTTSDLLAVYNKTTKVPSREEMLEFSNMLTEYNDLLGKQKKIDSFNSSIDEADNYRLELLQQAQIQVNNLLDESTKCADYISLNIYTEDINDLIKKDSEYKLLQRSANDVLSVANSYSAPVRVASLNVNWEEEQEKLDRYQKEITTARQITIGEYVLGDVYTVNSPLGEQFTITSNWGSRIDPITRSSVQYHSGTDFECEVGTEVHSIFNGTVLEAGDNWAMGNYVRIKHGDGVISLYGHLSEISVQNGQQVTQYQVIGKSGESGQRVSGPHLHFALFINGQSVDPAILLER